MAIWGMAFLLFISPPPTPAPRRKSAESEGFFSWICLPVSLILYLTEVRIYRFDMALIYEKLNRAVYWLIHGNVHSADEKVYRVIVPYSLRFFPALL